MKIDRIETFRVPPRWLFCRVETDDGLVGWGEPVVEGRAEAVAATVDILAESLVGEDPLRIEDHWQVMSKGGFYRGGPVLSSAVAGLDQALWDIAGKAYGAPVHALLGGPVRDRVRVYGWVHADEPAALTDAVHAQVAAGLTAVKMTAGEGKMGRMATLAEYDAVLERAATARAALGPGRDFAIDFHGRVTLPSARRLLTGLAEFHPLFVEEPVTPEHTWLLRDLVQASPVPIATGERLYSRSDFLPALQAGIAVAQPDLSHAGGISEVRRIAALAETFDVTVAPHCPLGPLALAASLQIGFATPNYLIQEQSIGLHYHAGEEFPDYLVDPEPFRFVDGHIRRLEAPGLGITIDEQAVRRASRSGHTWRGPLWRHDDGSLAEW